MALIEGFESISGSPAIPDDASWGISQQAGLTSSGSASNVTQGAQSYRVNGMPSGAIWRIAEGSGLGPSQAANSVSVDVTVSLTLQTTAVVRVLVEDYNNNNTAQDVSAAGQTGTFTLEVDISGFSYGVAPFFEITLDITGMSAGTGSVDVYWDNLRDDIAGGAGKINLGNITINKIYLGATEIKKVYLGTALVHDKS